MCFSQKETKLWDPWSWHCVLCLYFVIYYGVYCQLNILPKTAPANDTNFGPEEISFALNQSSLQCSTFPLSTDFGKPLLRVNYCMMFIFFKFFLFRYIQIFNQNCFWSCLINPNLSYFKKLFSPSVVVCKLSWHLGLITWRLEHGQVVNLRDCVIRVRFLRCEGIYTRIGIFF